MAELNFPDPSATPWADPLGSIWVHDGDGWTSTRTNVIHQEAKPDETLYSDGQEWVRTSDMVSFALYKYGGWVQSYGISGLNGIDGVEGVDGADGNIALPPYVSDGTDTFVAGNWVTDADNDGVYTDSGIAATAPDGRDGGSAFPIGTIFDFAGNVAPGGSLVCGAQEVTKTAYADLFAAIGTTWNTTGGAAAPAAGNFRLPPRLLGERGTCARGGTPGEHHPQSYRDHTHSANHGHTGDVSGSTSSDGDHYHDVDLEMYPCFIGDGPQTYDAYNNSVPMNNGGAHSHNMNGSISINSTNVTTSAAGSTTVKPMSIGVLRCIWVA